MLLCLDISQLLLKKRSGRGSDSISLALPCLGGGPGLVGLVMQWELPELDFSALPATSKKNCRTRKVRHATRTGELQPTGVRADGGRLYKPGTWLPRTAGQVHTVPPESYSPTTAAAGDDSVRFITHFTHSVVFRFNRHTMRRKFFPRVWQRKAGGPRQKCPFADTTTLLAGMSASKLKHTSGPMFPKAMLR